MKSTNIFVLALALVSMLVLNVGGVLAVHNSEAMLTPQWSPANSHVDYNVQFCKMSGDTVNEVRIYKNYDGSQFYTQFECVDTPGWEKLNISTYPACFYVADDTSPNYNPLDVNGECQNFAFSAHSPVSNSTNCNLAWKFETRDVNYEWKFLYNTTSVDDVEPKIIKTLGEPKVVKGGETWITQNTPITIEAYDQGNCSISGLTYCEYRYDVDGVEKLPWTKIVWDQITDTNQPHYKFTFHYNEDSKHKLEVRCFDVAKNMAYHTQEERVDTEHPTTAKTYGTPSFPDGINTDAPYPHFITTKTPITLTPVDPDPTKEGCNIGVEKTWWYDTVVNEKYCENQAACEAWDECVTPYDPCECKPNNNPQCVEDIQKICKKPLPDVCDELWSKLGYKSYEDCVALITWEDCVEKLVNDRETGCVSCDCEENWQLYRGPFYKPEESCHIIQFFSVDELGNKEPVQRQCVYVENKPPKVWKETGSPKIDDSGVKFTTSGTGTAGWSTEQSHSGSYSAKLTTITSTDQGRATLPFSGVLSDITSFSYWDYTVNGGTYGQLAIWPSIYLDANDDGNWDYYIQAEPIYTYGNPILNTWQQYDAYNMKWESAEGPDCPYSAPTLGQYISGAAASMTCPSGVVPFASRGYGSLKIIKIDMRAGYGGPWPNFVGYTDNVEINGNKVLSEASWWVTKNTPIDLYCEDLGEHPVDNVKIWYRIWDDVSGKWTGWVDPPEHKQIKFTEDSVHKIQYYCEDALGNSDGTMENPYEQTYHVDTTPPEITKTMLGTQGVDYLGACPPVNPSEECFVADNDRGGIHVDVTDGGTVCHVDNSVCTIEVRWHNNPQEPSGYTVVYRDEFGENGLDYKFKEDSTHEVVINCKDALGNEMAEDIETFLVDSTPPVTTKTYGDPHHPDNINLPGPYPHYITSNTPITLAANDMKVGVYKTYWSSTLIADDRYCYSEGSGCKYYNGPLNGTVNEYTGPFKIGEESCHVIEFYSVDKLGNAETPKRQCIFVDNKAPVTDKDVGMPKVVIGDKTYISQLTQVNLSCKDQLPHPSDHVALWYRYKVSDDCVNWGQWTTQGCTDGVYDGWCDSPVAAENPVVNKTIHFPSDSCHYIEYYCTDILGNNETVKSEIDVVDKKAPEITTTIVGPSHVIGEKTYIDGVTLIHVVANDPLPHPVDSVTCTWSYTLDTSTQPYYNDTTGKHNGWSPYMPAPFDINFPEETKHVLTVKCEDALDNENTSVSTYYVDKTPPVTTKTYGLPFFKNQSGVDWITSQTLITLTVEDAGLHKSGVKELNYRYAIVPDIYCENANLCAAGVAIVKAYDKASPLLYSDGVWKYTFTIPEESCHMIEFYAVDNVEKPEPVNRQCVFVDNSAPTPAKKVGDPKEKWTPGLNGDPVSYYYPEANERCWKSGNPIECWQVTTMTPITLDCVDAQPHPVDHEQACFKVQWDGDDVTGQYCTDKSLTTDGYCCVSKEMEFHFTKTSEHELEYYCVDALGNKGAKIDIEKFKVEDTSFNIEINKKWNLISTPVFLLDNSMDKVFEDVPGCAKAVWTYDAVNKQWHVYTPDGNAGNDDLTTMAPGDGYWVLANKTCTLTIGGSLMRPGPSNQANKTIVPGWNLIGYYGNQNTFGDGLLEYNGPNLWILAAGKNAQCSLYSLGEDILDKEFTGLYTYWEPDNPNQWKPLSTMNIMNPGAGYWLAVPQGGLYTPSTACGGGPMVA
jgi:hypothetical protein